MGYLIIALLQIRKKVALNKKQTQLCKIICLIRIKTNIQWENTYKSHKVKSTNKVLYKFWKKRSPVLAINRIYVF